MPTLPPPSGGTDFEAASDGVHLAICFMFIEYGSHPEMYKGKPKSGLTPTCRIGWEICDEDMSKPDEKTGVILPKSVTKRYTWSMSDKAILRKDLEMWRGQKFVDADFGQDGFNVRKLIGQPCMVTIANEQKGDKTYCNVIGLSRIYKGITVPKPRLKPVYVALNKEEWDGNSFDGLSPKAKDFIKQSPEYKALMGVKGESAKGNAYADQSGGRYKVDDPALNAAARGDPGYTQDPDRGSGFGGSDLDDEIPFLYEWR